MGFYDRDKTGIETQRRTKRQRGRKESLGCKDLLTYVLLDIILLITPKKPCFFLVCEVRVEGFTVCVTQVSTRALKYWGNNFIFLLSYESYRKYQNSLLAKKSAKKGWIKGYIQPSCNISTNYCQKGQQVEYRTWIKE